MQAGKKFNMQSEECMNISIIFMHAGRQEIQYTEWRMYEYKINFYACRQARNSICRFKAPEILKWAFSDHVILTTMSFIALPLVIQNHFAEL